jgi:hypothetical protein
MVHNLFGFGLDKDEFVQAFRSCDKDEREKVYAVSRRAYLADLLRYRLALEEPLRAPGFPDGHVASWFARERRTLEGYLLCTCIDALATEDFSDFADWLTAKKSGVERDAEFHKVVQSVVKQPNVDVLRGSLHRMWQKLYLPRFGNQQAFIRFFRGLPSSVKEMLAQAYVLSFGTFKKYPDAHDWSGACEKWNAADLDERMDAIAKYVYRHIRNPYTHEAKAPAVANVPDPQRIPPKVSDGSASIGAEFHSINDVVCEGKDANPRYRIRAIRGQQGEDDCTFLRLAVAAWCVTKLGYGVDSAYARGFRQFQQRRTALYHAVWEMEVTLDLLTFYTGKKPQPVGLQDWFPIQRVPTSEISKAREFLRTGTRLEGDPDRDIGEYLSLAERLNTTVQRFNDTYFPGGGLRPIALATRPVKSAWAAAQAALAQKPEIERLRSVIQTIRRWFDDLADRMV